MTGVITDLRESEIEREPGGWHDGARVGIELPGQDIFTTPALGGIAPADRKGREDMKITLLKVRVDDLITVMKTCLP